jgi:hypothetical protein
MSQCAKCLRRLKPEATSCICGWTTGGRQSLSDAIQRTFIGCDVTPGCVESALMRLGNLNCCPRCYAQRHKPAERKLFDNAVCREIRAGFARSQYARIAVERGVEAAKDSIRQPGEDDEERRAA